MGGIKSLGMWFWEELQVKGEFHMRKYDLELNI